MIEQEESERSRFGSLLQRYRLAAGLSQEALAERAQLSVAAIGALERGQRRHPYRSTFELLATALHLSPAEAREFKAAAARPKRPSERDVDAAVTADSCGGDKTNLLIHRKAFFGRDSEVVEIMNLLERSRLVTISGTGGIGKTRTALEVGSMLLNGSEAFVWLVDLSPIGDSSSVADAIARSLGVQGAPNRPVVETLRAYLRNKTFVLILDNCEHVIADAAIVAETLLCSNPGVHVLATSREPLRVAGERVYRLSSLPMPPTGTARGRDVAWAMQYPAIELFEERARAVAHDFRLRDETVPIVSEICRRLDGIPLAIELVATWVTILPVKALSEKLGQLLRVPNAGDRAALPRHQTMRALLDWSYDRLSPDERWLFESLSAFAGGCTLEGAAAVVSGHDLRGGFSPSSMCAAETATEGLDVVDVLSSLVDKSLVVAELDGHAPRYRLLQSSMEYAREKLLARGKQRLVAHRHALAYLDLAERLDRIYSCDRTPDRAWFAQAPLELNNWRTALAWALTERGDLQAGQRLVGALCPVWGRYARTEGQRWVRLALESVTYATPLKVVAKLDCVEAWLSTWLGEHDAALAAAERALARYRRIEGEPLGVAMAQSLAGRSLVALDRSAEAKSILREALETRYRIGNRLLVAWSLLNLGLAESADGDHARARTCRTQALATFTELGDEHGAGLAALYAAEDAFLAGDAETALRDAAASLASFRSVNDMSFVAKLNGRMAASYLALGQYEAAEKHAREALDLARDLGLDVELAFAVQHLAAIAAFRAERIAAPGSNELLRAARLLGFVNARVAARKVLRELGERREYEQILDVLHKAVGAEKLTKFMSAGASMTREQAIEAVLCV